jgi:hypothetical protein
MARALAALLISTLLALGIPIAHAGPGGSVPGPGLCDYPGIGRSINVAVIFSGESYYCVFPTEENGSQWVCYNLAGGLMGGEFQSGGNGLGGINIGGDTGGCDYRCPVKELPIDNRDPIQTIGRLLQWPLAAFPNPPSAWKNALTPKPCEPLDQQPVSAPAPVPQPPDQFPTGAPTNPDTPNPDATQNPKD